MAEAFWGAALGAFFTITGGWILRTFAVWVASDPERGRANRRARDRRILDLLERPGVYVGASRKQGAITQEYGAWPDRLRLWIQVSMWVAWRKCSPSYRLEARRRAEDEAALRQRHPELFQ